MPRRRFRRPGPALIVALLALAVALGGTGYAAVSLPANSVGTEQLKNRAVTEQKVSLRSLRARDFAAGQIPPGPRGVQGQPGPRGPTGAAGPAGPPGSSGGGATVLWAEVAQDGTLEANQGVTGVSHGGSGDYQATVARDVSKCAVTATTNTFAAQPSMVTATVLDAQTVEVQTFDPTGSHADQDFSLAIFC